MKLVMRDVEARLGQDEHGNEGQIYVAVHDCKTTLKEWFGQKITHRKIVLTLDRDLHLNSMQDIDDLYDVLVTMFEESNEGLQGEV